MYGENTFIVLSTKEQEACFRIRLHSVPIVSEDFSAVDHFSEHSLYMRLEGPRRKNPDVEECDCEYCKAPPPEKRRLLLSDDLPALIHICLVINHMDPNPTFVSAVPRGPCDTEQWANAWLPFEQNLVDAPRDGTFRYRRICDKRKPSTTLIRFQNNTYGSTTPSFVEETLTQLRKVAGDRKVDIIAPSHPSLAAECKERMTPKIVWGYAIAWDLVEVARELKAEADEVSQTNTGVDD